MLDIIIQWRNKSAIGAWILDTNVADPHFRNNLMSSIDCLYDLEATASKDNIEYVWLSESKENRYQIDKCQIDIALHFCMVKWV